MRHAIKRIDTSQKKQIRIPQKMRRVNVCLFLQDTLTRLYNIFNFKKVSPFSRATPQLCIMNYTLNQALRFYSTTGRTDRP